MIKLEEKLEYSFNDPILLKNALTHSSYANENRAEGIPNNERLEFLGDSVLGFVTAKHLYSMKPTISEGKMTRLRAELVCEKSLHEVAKELSLGDYLRIGKGEERSGGRQRASILADAVEAVIAAIFLDGGMEPAEKFIKRMLLTDEKIAAHHATDYKTVLQELIQRKPGQLLEYVEAGETGPDHDKRFLSDVRLNGETIGSGSGRTKKEAEQSAARAALERLNK